MKSKLLYFLLFLSCSGFAQLLDDSTKAIYGTHSTRFYHEKEVLFNDSTQYALDTTLDEHHLYHYNYKDGIPYQDLGALASPMKPIYPEARKVTGIQLGMDNTNAFAYSNDKIRYFDTKSPYSELSYYQNFKKQEYFDAQFSRSASKNFNFGFQLTRMAANNQIGATSGNAKFIDGYAATMYTSLKALKNHYRLLANLKYLDYQIFDNGGVFDNGGTISEDSLFLNFAQVNLSEVSSQDRRANYHLYHHLSIDSLGSLQLFHTFDREHRRNIYRASALNTPRPELNGQRYLDFYPATYLDSAAVIDSTRFTVYENKLGLKGTLLDISYMAYVKYRNFNYLRNADSTTYTFTTGNEMYLGGALQRKLWEGAKLNLSGEVSKESYLLSQNSITSDLFDVQFNYTVLPPSAIIDSTYNNHFIWKTQFDNQTDMELTTKVKYKSEALKAELRGTYLVNTNYIYFNQTLRPTQYKDLISTIKVSGKIHTHLGKFHLLDEATFASTSNQEIIRIPSYFNHLQLSYRTTPRAKHYLLMMGIDIFSRGSYFADAYMPYIQQFYLQDNTELKAYSWADIFISLKVKNARIFLKMPHVTQGLFGSGYFVTPNYFGQRRVLELGFNWRFFD